MEQDKRLHMGSLSQCWLRKIKKAEEAKKGFSEIAEMCRQFFSGSVGFMWEDRFRSRYLKNVTPPRFRVTIAKAFELVAVFGPSLFWRYPGRVIKSRGVFQPDPSIFGDPEDPAVQQMVMEFQQEMARETSERSTRDKLMETYLNYSQREQPGGGLKVDGQYAVTEALVKGRGVTWCENYAFPGSERVLTGNFFDSVDNLLIDPDSKRPNLSDAKWIARRHCDPYWKIERRFGLKGGTLRDRGKHKSADAIAHEDATSRPYASTESSGDLVVWYEVFSKCGVGTRERGILPSMHESFESVLGDFAYICVCDGVDYPLNAPKDRFEEAYDEQILEMFDWPIPFYKDGRWPCAWLDFYPNPNSAWPLAPMAMGLGELIFLNTMMSVLCERAYENSRLLIAALKGHAEDAVAKIKSGGMKEIIEISSEYAQHSVNDLIGVIQMPEIGFDLFRMINMVSAMFDKRTGLSELLYGMNPGGSASRTAADINVKSEMASVRPEYMSQQVEEWQTEVANLERIAASWTVRGQDLQPLLGNVGSMMWDQLVSNDDPEVLVREMRCTVEANSIRKPNKVRDNENIQRISQFIFPELSRHAQLTGDTAPMNNFIEDLGLAMEQDTSRWAVPDRQQEPDEEAMQSQQMMQQLAAAKEEAEVQKKLAQAENISMAAAKIAKEIGDSDAQPSEVDEEFMRQSMLRELEFQAKQAEESLKLDSKAAENELDLMYQQDLNMLRNDANSVS